MGDDRDQAANDLPPEWLSDAPAADPDERSLLRQLAADPDSEMVELTSGVYYIAKPQLRPDRDKLS